MTASLRMLLAMMQRGRCDVLLPPGLLPLVNQHRQVACYRANPRMPVRAAHPRGDPPPAELPAPLLQRRLAAAA